MGQRQIFVYDIALNLLGILEDYQEAIYQRSFFSAGEFTISINLNVPNATLLDKQRIVIFGDDPRDSGIITQLTTTISEDGKGSQILTAKGYDLRYILAQRVIKELNSADAYYALGPAETVIKNLVNSQCGSGSAIAERRFTNLVIAADQGRGIDYTLNAKYTTVYEECVNAATKAEIGWYVVPDVEAKTFTLEIEEGLNRAAAQSANPLCIFTPDYESLRSATFDDNLSNFRNFVYVGGDGSGSDRQIFEGYDGTEPTGLDRHEMFDDASGLTTSTDLAAEAAALLNQYKQSFTLVGQGLVKSPYVYKENYAVGDVVTVRFNGTESDVRVLDVTESWSFGSYELDATWGRPIPTASQQIGKLAGRITSGNATSEAGTNTTAMKNFMKAFDISSADLVMAATDCLYNVYDLTGTIAVDRVVTLYFDPAKEYGRKVYQIILTAKADTGTRAITIGAGGTKTVTLTVNATHVPENYTISVDENRNVISGKLSSTDATPGTTAEYDDAGGLTVSQLNGTSPGGKGLADLAKTFTTKHDWLVTSGGSAAGYYRRVLSITGLNASYNRGSLTLSFLTFNVSLGADSFGLLFVYITGSDASPSIDLRIISSNPAITASNLFKAVRIGAGAWDLYMKQNQTYTILAVELIESRVAGNMAFDSSPSSVADPGGTAPTVINSDSELLAQIKRVDGSGSGLDADVVRATTPGAGGLLLLALPALSSSSPNMDGTASAGTSNIPSRQDHRHPVDTSRAPLNSPGFAGTPTAPTAKESTDSTQLATTAFVHDVVPPGLIVPYAGSSAPTGWLLCNGATVDRTAFAGLFAVIGETYGAGNGSTTFNVPDMRELIPVGIGTNAKYTISAHDTFTLAQFKDDQMQGHGHRYHWCRLGRGSGDGGDLDYITQTPSNTTDTRVGIPITSGTNGTPRTGTTTRGKLIGMNYIIKT